MVNIFVVESYYKRLDFLTRKLKTVDKGEIMSYTNQAV